ncbi:uncharacterized protein DDB_G0286591-like [Panonychus citri]|uniref:uncharacterized protein DDB_G0286591-like n=1 Tax=Panonychus citri TaxID=50023 RepID=UPI002307B66A|nr:uncharacterized protein DDB_G0286591-like [Panonychus citri]
MIRLSINRYHHYFINSNNQVSPSVLIVYQHVNQFVFHCLLILSLLTYSVESELNLTTKLLTTTTPINLIDSDDLTTSYSFLNPITLVNHSSEITESTLTVDLTTTTINDYNNLTNNKVNQNETRVTIKPTTTINPSHVTVFLDGDDEVNTLPSTIKSNGNNNNLIDSESITSNEISNSSSPTINPNVIFKSPSTLTNTIKDNETSPPPPTTTINLNLSSETLTIDSESTTTTLTIDMIDNENNDTTINSTTTTINQANNVTTDLLIDKSNETICDSNNNQIADHSNQRLTIDHYEAKKFFLLTMILLGLCCLLILIVLILVVYIFRKLTRERTIKIPQVNSNHFPTGGGSIEFDTIKDGRFYQWQGNVNSGFDQSDLNESTTQSTGYRFLEGSVVPYTDRYHNDIKTSSTETFGHHQNQSNHHLNQPSLSSSSINSLPKATTTTTVDTRL